MAYNTFYEAYKAKHPDYNPWTPQQKQQLTNAYVGGYVNPSTGDIRSGNLPTKEMVAGGYAPPAPTFNPYSDPYYITGAGAINESVQNAQAQHDYRQLSGEQNFGVYAGGPLKGQVIGDSAYAGYNPYSQAAILQKNYDATRRGTLNSYAANGQLYSGALVNKRADDAYNFSRSGDALKRAAADFYNSNNFNLQNAQNQGTKSINELVLDALTRFLQGQANG